MAWAVKYQANFKDVNDVSWIIYFDEDAWGGAITTFTPGPVPITLTWNQSDKYQPIIGSTADIQLLYESDIDELYTEDSQDIRVSAYRDGSLFWQGFLSPGQYFRQFNKPVHMITLTASDGLGELKDEKFEDGSGDPYYYSTTEIVTIANILLKTGITTTIYDAVNIYEDGYDSTVAHSPLAQTYIWPEMYWDEITDSRGDCYTVLSDILKKYGATVRYSYGHWYLLRPNDYSAHDDIYYRVFTSAGVYSSNTSFTSYNSIDTSMYYIHANQEVTRLRGYGSSEITLAPRERSNTLKNGSFNDFTWTGVNADYWGHSSTVPAKNNVGDTIAIGTTESASQPTNYLYARVWLYKAKSIRLTLDYKAVYAGSPTHVKIHVGLVYAGGQYYAPKADTWSTSSYPTTSSLAYDLIADSKASMSDFESIVVEPSRGPWDATEGGYGFFSYLDIRLYELQNETTPMGGTNYVAYDQVYLEVDQDGTLPREKIYIFDNSVNSLTSIHQGQLALGDSYVDDLYAGGNDDIFNGVTQDTAGGSGNETNEWFIKGHSTTVATPEPVAELLARQMVEGCHKSLDLIRGSIRSAHTNVPHVAFDDSDFTDEYGFNKRFLPHGISYDAHRNEWAGEWVDCPAIYTDEEMEWASNECDAGKAVMTANEIEVSEWTSPDMGNFASFDDYTTVAGETIRIVMNIVDDGSSDLPRLKYNGANQERSWGLNYYTFYNATVGAKTITLTNAIAEDAYFNFTCTLDVYSLTGV